MKTEESKYHYGREIIFNLRSCYAITPEVYLHWLDKINEEEAIAVAHSCTAERTVKGEKVLGYDEFKEKWFDKKEGIIYVDKLTTDIVDVNFILNTYQEYCNRL